MDVALAIAPVVIIPFMLFGGFFLNSDSVPVSECFPHCSSLQRMIQPKVWLSWLKWVSWFIYSYEALLVNQWSGVEGIACSPEAPNACLSSGEEVGLKWG